MEINITAPGRATDVEDPRLDLRSPRVRSKVHAEDLALLVEETDAEVRADVHGQPRATRPEPLVPHSLVVGIQERIDYTGEVLLALDVEDVRVKIRRLVDNGAEAFVVALVNSVVNPSHEERIEEIIRDEYPSSLFGSFPVILSHRISRRKSEYARTMAAVVNISPSYLGIAWFVEVRWLTEPIR